MKEQYTDKAKQVLKYAKKISGKLGHSYTGTEHILLGLIKQKDSLAGSVLEGFHVDEDKVLDYIDQLIAPVELTTLNQEDSYTPRAEKILVDARTEADRFHEKKIGTEHLLIAILKDYECIAAKLLKTLNISARDVYMEVLNSMGEEGKVYREEQVRENQMKERGSSLERYSRDLTMLAEKDQLDPVIGRTEEIKRIIQILSRRTKNNPCLVGEPGVGKSAIVEGLAQAIVHGNVPENMKDKRLIMLDLTSMVAGTKYRGEFEERIKTVIDEVRLNGNLLLFIDELHMMIGAGGAEGAMDASNILKPYLSRGEIQLIGATTIAEYRKYIEKDPALERRFQPVSVEEPTEEETVKILEGLREAFEEHHRVTITDEALQAAARLSERYIHDRFLPDKAIDVIDEAAAKVRLGNIRKEGYDRTSEEKLKQLQQLREEKVFAEDYEAAKALKGEIAALKEKLEKDKKTSGRGKKSIQVLESDVEAVISGWTKIPLEKLAAKESERLKNLETILHRRVVGQEEAVCAVAKAVKRGRIGLKDPKRPIGSFLFLGPTGVGKTELSKALAEVLFGSENSMIRVDMSEYMEKHSVSKMIGSPPGYVGHDDGGQLSEKVRRNPYSVILFDEIEKAHPDVFNILLQVLDDGRITDSQGRVVDFKNTVIIMTSNAGANAIISPKKLGFGAKEDEKADYERMKSGVMEEVKRIFKPEFLNRIDDIIVFHTLKEEHLKKIAGLLQKELAKRCREQMGIELQFRSTVKNLIVEEGRDEKYGARPLKRAIQTKVEDALTDEILSGNVKAGDIVSVGVAGKKCVFKIKPKCEAFGSRKEN